MKELHIILRAKKDKWDIEKVEFKVKNKFKPLKWIEKLFQSK